MEADVSVRVLLGLGAVAVVSSELAIVAGGSSPSHRPATSSILLAAVRLARGDRVRQAEPDRSATPASRRGRASMPGCPGGYLFAEEAVAHGHTSRAKELGS